VGKNTNEHLFHWIITHLEFPKRRLFKERFHISTHAFAAIGIIALGVFIRFLLVFQNWPHIIMDEGTMGEMALHIAYRGDHPIFFYGQDYMGALEAYLAAGLFHLFGASLFTLRLGLVFLFALFLISMYLLSRLLYTKKLALFSTFLLGLGASLVIYRELQAIGGYPDTLLFSSLALLLASWLALSSVISKQKISPGRLFAYFGWGLAVGLGLWSDLLIIPCVLMSGLLLLAFCWRDLRTWAPVCLLLGLVIGALPLIIFNLHARPGHDSLSILLTLTHESGPSVSQRLQSIIGALLVSLPTITNYNLVCYTSDTLFLGGSGLGAVQCTLAQGAWALGAIILWISAILLAAGAIWKIWYHIPAKARSFEQRQDIIRSCAHIAVLLAVGMSFVLFAISPTTANSPYLNSRYLFCLLIGTPTVIYPLWKGSFRGRFLEGILRIRRQDGRHPKAPQGSPSLQDDAKSQDVLQKLSFERYGKAAMVSIGLKQAILLLITIMFLVGTVRVLLDIPNTQALNRQQYDLVHNLLRIGAKHIYSEFWSCDRIIFQSMEQIVCDTVDDQLRSTGDRYTPNERIVLSDPQSSYVFPIDTPLARACALHFAHSSKQYQRFIFDGYVVYHPEPVASG
jgi:4-amino-4-deoxy-L-arabinose transferase-like glycosyltransferase